MSADNRGRLVEWLFSLRMVPFLKVNLFAIIATILDASDPIISLQARPLTIPAICAKRAVPQQVSGMDRAPIPNVLRAGIGVALAVILSGLYVANSHHMPS